MKLEDFDYELPEELIAQVPLENRSASRLMVLDKETGEVEHHHFPHIVNELEAGDCLILNDTRVLPARLIGLKEETGAHIEVLLIKQTSGDEWETLVKPAKRIKKGTIVTFGEGLLKAVCTAQPFPAISIKTNGIAKLVIFNHCVAWLATCESVVSQSVKCCAPSQTISVKLSPTIIAIQVACTPCATAAARFPEP